MSARHRLVTTSFDAIAAGQPDPAGLSVLRGSQLSKHLLMLRMIIDSMRTRPSRWVLSPAEASAVSASLELLTEAHRCDPTAAGGVLGYPYVGAWLVRCLRELRRSQGQPPLTHLTGIVAAAAIRAGLDFELAVWCTAGMASLPSIGSGFSGQHPPGPVTVRRRAVCTTVGNVELASDPSRDRVGWSGLQRLTSTTTVPISVMLDDLDPYRATPAMHATERLRRTSFTKWQKLFATTWRLLCRHHHTWATQLTDLLVALTPLQGHGPTYGMSATTRQAFGAIALTRPHQAQGFAASLCHELQHAKLNALLDLVDLCEFPDERMYYAPWRADPRPLMALLHGTYAFLGVADFWQRQSATDDNARARYEFVRVRLQVSQALEVLQRANGFTAAGCRFITGMATWADRLFIEQIPERERRFAELAGDDHHVTWRLRNLHPDPTSVQTFVEAWRARRSAPMIHEPALAPHSEQFVQSSRARLLAAAAADHSPPHPVGTASTRLAAVYDGDVHLAEGRYDHAAASYRTALSRHSMLGEALPAAASDDVTSVAAWTGLSLARQRTADSAEAAIWRSHPEFVHALYHALATQGGTLPSPEELARWLGATAN